MLVMAKTNKKKSETKKKVVVPNAMMQMPLHHRHLVLVEVQVLGKADHRSNGQMETCRIKNEGSDFSEKWHRENDLLGAFFLLLL